MIYAWSVGLSKDVAFPLKRPLLKQRHILMKESCYEPKALESNNAANEENEVSLFHPQNTTNPHSHFN